MMKQENNEWDARVCDICQAAASKVYCRADSAYLCAGCDNDVHSANPLARRHHRVPLLPMTAGGLYATHAIRGIFLEDYDHDNGNGGEDEAASWFSLKNNDNQQLLFGREDDGDQYLDLVEYNNNDQQYNSSSALPDEKNYGGDSVVPVQGVEITTKEQLQFKQPNYVINPSLTQPNISMSSMDVGIVPESTIDQTPIITQLSPMDREARVLRYREKKKMRKFEKTIRYASRKAYAETRPRIKGRFAKRTDAEFEADNMFSTSRMVETGYGIVPSF